MERGIFIYALTCLYLGKCIDIDRLRPLSTAIHAKAKPAPPQASMINIYALFVKTSVAMFILLEEKTIFSNVTKILHLYYNLKKIKYDRAMGLVSLLLLFLSLKEAADFQFELFHEESNPTQETCSDDDLLNKKKKKEKKKR